MDQIDIVAGHVNLALSGNADFVGVRGWQAANREDVIAAAKAKQLRERDRIAALLIAELS